MDFVLLLARLLVGGVFLLAGAGKLLDRAGSRQAMREFGLPAAAAVVAGIALPIIELAVAVALLPISTAWFGALAAVALTALFIAGVGVSLARGRRPACHCFGQLYSAPISWRTLARNAALAAIAAFIVVTGHGDAGTDVLAWLGGATVAAWIALGLGLLSAGVGGVVLWLLAQIVAQNGRLLVRIDGLEQRLVAGGGAARPALQEPPGAGLAVGTPAPGFQLPGLHGEVLTLDALRAAGRPVLLAFVDPGCGPCTDLLPDLARWQQQPAGAVSLAVLSRGSVEENRAKAGGLGLTQVLLQKDREVGGAYEALATPSMVLVRPDGTIGSPLARGAEEIRALAARTLGAAQPTPQATLPIIAAPANGAQAAPSGQPCPQCGKVHDSMPATAPAGLTIGTPAPPLRLPDLDGREVDLAELRGRDTVVLFWNPGCGFCQQLLPQLKDWEANRPAEAPALLVVSTGEPATNAAQGIASQVLLQDGFQAGTAFGVTGTPAAVLVDRAGAIASAPVGGGPAVLALLGAHAS